MTTGQGINAGRCALVVDDEPSISRLLEIVLEQDGFRVVTAPDGRAAIRALFAERPDIVLLDIDMPELNGWDALARIREASDVPVMMLTAASGQEEKVRALRAGADDYLTKPFGVDELLARVQALLRRVAPRSQPREEEKVYDDGCLRIDFARRAVTACDEELRLTPVEYRLLLAFARHPDHTLSHGQLIQLAWNAEGYGTGDQVRVYVGYLRRKLDALLPEPTIETVRGFGYRYRPVAVAGTRP